MRITFVTDAAAPQINGVVTTLDKTTRLLAERGHIISLVTPNDFTTIPLLGYNEIKIACDVWKTGKRIERTNPDSLHIVTEGPLGFSARLWAVKHGVVFTTSYHTRFPEYIEDRLGFGAQFCYRALRWFHNRSAAMMVNTKCMEDLLADRGFKNICHWGRGVDTDLYQPVGPIPELYNSLPRPIMLNVGRLAIEKNLPEFYELKLPGSFVQVGSGPALPAFQKKYPHVHFIGSKTGEELASYYRGADVFVFPSMSDTLGLVMLESIASGVPVAAMNVVGPKDVVIDGFTGCLGPLNTAIPMALDLRQGDFKDHLRAWALTQSWEACTDEFESMLVKI